MDLLVNQDETIIKIDKDIITGKGNTYKLSTGERIAPADKMTVVEVSNIPTEVEEQKYCYNSTDGFYKNPDYSLPADERLDKLEQATGTAGKTPKNGIASRLDDLESRIEALESR